MENKRASELINDIIYHLFYSDKKDFVVGDSDEIHKALVIAVRSIERQDALSEYIDCDICKWHEGNTPAYLPVASVSEFLD